MICEGSPTSCEFILKKFQFVFVLNSVQNGRNILKIDGTNIIDHQPRSSRLRTAQSKVCRKTRGVTWPFQILIPKSNLMIQI